LHLSKDVDAMTELFLYWLEFQAIENGAEVVGPKERQKVRSPTPTG
jgi:hypothetical protein